MSEPQSSALVDARARLFNHFASTNASEHGAKWDELWAEGFLPWDRGRANPALIDLLQERHTLFGEAFVVDPGLGKRRKRALVPGCGKGYDVLLLSAYGYDVCGLDISYNALKAAKETENNYAGDPEYKARDETIGKGKITWLAGDFFKDGDLVDIGGDGTFDLLYDYTVG